MLIFRPRLLLPFALSLVGCSFFTLEEPAKGAAGAPATGGTGGSGGTGGATGGAGGTGGATGGTGGSGGASGSIGVAGAGMGGIAGGTAGAGAGGASAGSAGDPGAGGVAGAAGDGAGGTPVAGAAGMGVAGDAGAGGSSGGAGSGAGGSGPVSCMMVQGTAFGGHCYALNTGAATWQNARSACESRNPAGHLVTITSQAEQDFVWGVATMQNAWIGATDGLADDAPGNGTPSTWITSEDITQYNGWAQDEPNNYMKTCPSGSGDCWEHCGFMQQSSNGAWNDEICGATMAYVCEWDSGG